MDEEEQRNEALAITAGDLRRRLEGVPDDAKLYGYVGMRGGVTEGTVTFKVQAEWVGDGSYPLRKLVSLTTSVTGGGLVR